MTATKPQEKKTGAARRGPPMPKIGGGSLEARRFAVMILDVLAGVRTPMEAAEGMACSLPRYYAVESRALEGFVEACEPKPCGGKRRPEKQIAVLQDQVKRLERDLARRQALARLSQRAVGLAAPEPRKPEKGKKRRKPTVRALRMIRALEPEGAVEAEESTPPKPRGIAVPGGGADGAQADGS